MHRVGRLLHAVILLSITVSTAIGQTYQEHPALSKAIDETDFAGAILVFDKNNSTFFSGHTELVNQQFLPASTFKIFSALVALESEVIANNETIIAWDGVTRGRTETNRDLDLQTAFRVSAVPHFQHLVRKIGSARMQDFLTQVAYGNQDMTGGDDTFWLTGGLRISLREQIDFLRRLEAGELPFAEKNMAAVKEMMLTEETNDHRIRAKTGWATLDNGENTGWWVGWIETDSNTVFFATLLLASNPNDTFGPARISATRQALAAMGILDATQ